MRYNEDCARVLVQIVCIDEQINELAGQIEDRVANNVLSLYVFELIKRVAIRIEVEGSQCISAENVAADVQYRLPTNFAENFT